MPTCNDCIHQELCNIYANAGVTDIPADDITSCNLFKNKADVVEVVRCSECQHWSKKIGMCLYCYGLHYNAINPSRENDYCSYGERKNKTTLPETTRQTVLNSFMKGSED